VRAGSRTGTSARIVNCCYVGAIRTPHTRQTDTSAVIHAQGAGRCLDVIASELMDNCDRSIASLSSICFATTAGASGTIAEAITIAIEATIITRRRCGRRGGRRGGRSNGCGRGGGCGCWWG
jgi:hypothetical protein